MKTVKLFHVLFSFAIIAALVAAAIPAAPAHALGGSNSQSASLSAVDSASNAGAVVCRSKVVWRDGHRVVVRVCHRVPPRPEADAS